MKQHNLLFRYLDGEISREEDQILREQLTEDKDFNEDFQTFLEIDYNINKLNEEIEFPDDFLNEVGNNIQTKLAVDQQVRQIRKELNARYTQRFVLVPALIALFISIFVSNIENPFLNLNKVFSSNKNETINQSKTNQVSDNINVTVKAKNLAKKVTKNIFAITKNSTNSDNKSQNISSNVPTEIASENNVISTEKIITNSPTTASNAMTNIIEEGANQNYIETLGNNITTISSNNSGEYDLRNKSEKYGKSNAKYENGFSNYSVNSNYNNNYGNSSRIDKRNSSVDYLPFDQSINFSGNFADIELKTIVGTDLFNFGVDKNKTFINSFTQSFASKIDDFNKIGLETGYSEFNSKVMKYVEIKNGKTTSSKLLSKEDFDENPVLIRIENIETQLERLFWVGVFYELDYLKGENYALSSRLTLGATDVGAYSSLKFMINYKLFKNVNVTVGSDARIFNGKFNAATKKEVNSTLSLIYGLNFAF